MPTLFSIQLVEPRPDGSPFGEIQVAADDEWDARRIALLKLSTRNWTPSLLVPNDVMNPRLATCRPIRETEAEHGTMTLSGILWVDDGVVPGAQGRATDA
jgi:hypothetical protein